MPAHLTFRDAYRLADADQAARATAIQDAENRVEDAMLDAMATADAAADDLASVLARCVGLPDCDLDALVSFATRVAQVRDEARVLLGVQS